MPTTTDNIPHHTTHDDIETTQPMETVMVIGAGTMGHGIAHVAALSGCTVYLCDVSEQAARNGLGQIKTNLNKGVTRGKLTQEQAAEAMRKITPTIDLIHAAAESDLIIEAVVEMMAVKREIFTTISQVAPAHTIFATNTSSLSVTEIAAAATDPSRVVGMHFFNPPYILKLLELVKAYQTSDKTLEQAQLWGKKLGRELVVVNDSPGFASSRLGLVLGLEAIRMVQEGVASAAEIDRAMELGYKHPMGPLKLTDLVGLDVRLAIAEYLHTELGGDRFLPPPLMRKMVRAGQLGKKSGQGFYRWN